MKYTRSKTTKPNKMVTKFHSKSSNFNRVIATAIINMDKIIDGAPSRRISNIFTSANVASEWKSSFCWKFVNVIIKKTATNTKFLFFFFFITKENQDMFVTWCNSLLRLFKIILWQQKQQLSIFFFYYQNSFIYMGTHCLQFQNQIH